MKKTLSYNFVDPSREAPVKEPETIPVEPNQAPEKEGDPSEWDVPAPSVQPGPKAFFYIKLNKNIN